jgi:hypothetical protein
VGLVGRWKGMRRPPSKRISRVHVIRFGKSIVGRNKSLEIAKGGTMGFVKKKTYKEKSLMKHFHIVEWWVKRNFCM